MTPTVYWNPGNGTRCKKILWAQKYIKKIENKLNICAHKIIMYIEWMEENRKKTEGEKSRRHIMVSVTSESGRVLVNFSMTLYSDFFIDKYSSDFCREAFCRCLYYL